jgi:DNA-binding NarL/FixJ family response regulator
VIVTNAGIPPAQVLTFIPVIRVRYPEAAILVLSGYGPAAFVAELYTKGIEGFLPLPFDESALTDTVSTLITAHSR